MKDRTEFLYSMNEVDGPVIRFEPWVSLKASVEEFGNFRILKSDPAESASNIIQFSIEHLDVQGDLFRVDSYKEGYFAAVWLSTVTLQKFLDAAKGYFQEFEHKFSGEIHGTFDVLTSFREPEIFDFWGPITAEDFEREGIFLGDETHELTLLRINTPPGDLCYKPEDEKVDIIVDLDRGDEQPVIEAVARFVTKTQSFLTEAVIKRVLEILPYKRIPTEN